MMSKTERATHTHTHVYNDLLTRLDEKIYNEKIRNVEEEEENLMRGLEDRCCKKNFGRRGHEEKREKGVCVCNNKKAELHAKKGLKMRGENFIKLNFNN